VVVVGVALVMVQPPAVVEVLVDVVPIVGVVEVVVVVGVLVVWTIVTV
jgi:hypothetical protein